MMFRPAMCGVGLFRALSIFSAGIFTWPMRRCSSMLRFTRRDSLPAGQETKKRLWIYEGMKRSVAKAKSEPRGKRLPSSDFMRKAMAAMRRAQKVAARENARFGLKLIVQES
jgi:hypothetical protein